MLTDIPRLTTNQIPTNLTVGTSSNCSEVYVGQWDRCWVGMRTELLMTPLTERYADLGQIAWVCWLRADVQLAQPAAFNVITGIRP